MKLHELKRLVEGGENLHVEFKRKVRFPEKIVREVVAFANTEGGHLLIGVDDDGTLPGLKFPEDETHVLSDSIRQLCRPAIRFTVEQIRIRENRSILHYRIHAGRKKPYYARASPDEKYGKAFVRVEDKSIQASREIRAILKHHTSSRDTGFVYGEHEKMLLNFLGENPSITLTRFMELSGLSRRKASDMIVNLALSNVIRAIPKENEDEFIFVE